MFNKRNKDNKSKTYKRKRNLTVFSNAILLVYSLVTISLLFFTPVNKVSGISMLPTFKNGDYIISYNTKDVSKGDIIVINVASLEDEENNKLAVKRVIATEGDTIEVKQGTVILNGSKLKEDFVTNTSSDDVKEVTVPLGYVYVMGDNRLNSKDSRFYGVVPERLIKSKVMRVIYSNNK